MKITTRILALLIALVAFCGISSAEGKDGFQYWRKDAPALTALVNYVEDVTNESSENYIPEIDRIAVFDMDGTLYGELAPIYVEWWMYLYRVNEDPSFIADEAEKALAAKIEKAVKTGEIPDDIEAEHAKQNARIYAGMTVDGYKQYVREFISKNVVGFDNMTFKEAFYQPMIEVIQYLKNNDFIVYICSGTDRFLCRELTEGVLPIPDYNIIGMDVMLKALNQKDRNGLDYVYVKEDEMIRTDELLLKTVKMNKVTLIAREIGQQPVLAFGNSSGDESMAMYTMDDNPYKSMVFMVVADDDVRDYGNLETAAKRRNKWEAHGWNVISMKNDFLTIYGDDAVKTSK